MNQQERRQKLLEVLCIRRHDTYDNLAQEFHVCKRTIRYDIAALMCSYPIETVCGRYGGGVKVADGFYLNRKHTGNTLNAEQTALLIRLRVYLSGPDLAILDSILSQFVA